MNAKNGMRPVHPGEILREELDELGLSANALSRALGVPVNRVTMILNGQRGLSADTALRLARFFGTTPQLWLNLQKTWELRRTEIEAGREIAEQVTPRARGGVEDRALLAVHLRSHPREAGHQSRPSATATSRALQSSSASAMAQLCSCPSS